MHVIEVRQMVEPGLARLAAENRKERDLQDLDRNLGDLEMCDPKDAPRAAEFDLDFHSIIARASANPIIPVMLNPLSLMPKIKSLVISRVEDAKSSAVEYRRKIIDH